MLCPQNASTADYSSPYCKILSSRKSEWTSMENKKHCCKGIIIMILFIVYPVYNRKRKIVGGGRKYILLLLCHYAVCREVKEVRVNCKYLASKTNRQTKQILMKYQNEICCEAKINCVQECEQALHYSTNNQKLNCLYKAYGITL